jgi:hypothetical protein
MRDASPHRERDRRPGHDRAVSAEVIGDVRVTYDRGDDYFAGGRLVGQSDPLVAEQDGALVAVHCVLNHELRVSGLA